MPIGTPLQLDSYLPLTPIIGMKFCMKKNQVFKDLRANLDKMAILASKFFKNKFLPLEGEWELQKPLRLFFLNAVFKSFLILSFFLNSSCLMGKLNSITTMQD